MPSIWEALRVNFTFGADDEEPRILCMNCDDNALATNPDQVVKWAKRHLANCPGLVPESDASDLPMFDSEIFAYEEREILSDE